jgi:hypothetical protein
MEIEDIVRAIVPDYCNSNRDYVIKMPVVTAMALLIKGSGWWQALDTFDEEDKKHPGQWNHPPRLSFRSEPDIGNEHRPLVYFDVRNGGNAVSSKNLSLWISARQMQIAIETLSKAEWLP